MRWFHCEPSLWTDHWATSKLPIQLWMSFMAEGHLHGELFECSANLPEGTQIRWVCRNVMFTTHLFLIVGIPPINMVTNGGWCNWHCYTNINKNRKTWNRQPASDHPLVFPFLRSCWPHFSTPKRSETRRPWPGELQEAFWGMQPGELKRNLGVQASCGTCNRHQSWPPWVES